MSEAIASTSSFGGGGGGAGGDWIGKGYHWRQRMERLEKENRILKATNKHLKTLLVNANREIDSLKELVGELEESCEKSQGLICTKFRDLATEDEEDLDSGQGQHLLKLLPEEVTKSNYN